jgi:energy-coupling factor transport system permease protein
MTGTSRPPRPVVLLRPVPGRSVVHELWAGTKLIVVAAIGVLLTLYPGWVPIAIVGALVLVTAWVARIPRGVLPSVPRWLWVLLFFGALTASFAGGRPHVVIASVDFGFGGLLKFLQITVLSVVLLGLGGLVSWTTNVAEIAPAVAKIGSPLRLLRLPVDDWAVTLSLALRAFPMLIEEFRVLVAARKLRPRETAGPSRERRHRMSSEIVDLLAAAVTVTLRRADEMGDAITARGGPGQISALPSGPKWADAVAFAVLVLLCAASVYVELYTPLATSV